MGNNMTVAKNSWEKTYGLYGLPLGVKSVPRQTDPTPKDNVHEYMKGINADFVVEKYGKAIPIHYFSNNKLHSDSIDMVLQMLEQHRCAVTPAVRSEIETVLERPLLPNNSTKPEVIFAFKCEKLETVLH